MDLRSAENRDTVYLAQCFVNIALHLKSICRNAYVNGLPGQVNEYLVGYLASFIMDEDAGAFICEDDRKRVGCIVFRIEETSFPPSGIGKVGNITACWVEDAYRRRGVAARLVSATESWFKENGITNVELSYLACNTVAEPAWREMGYRPFRVFSHKTI